jgi:hypothetical protein
MSTIIIYIFKPWPFPAGATVSPGEFKIIFADAQTNISTLSELHTTIGSSFTTMVPTPWTSPAIT